MDAASSRAARLRLTALFGFVTVGFALFRRAPFVIWDDSYSAFLAQESVKQTPLGTLCGAAFASVTAAGYRPLAALFSIVSLRFLYVPDGPTVPHLLLIGCIYGALAVCLVALARRFCRYEATGYFVVLLVLASPPLVATSWVLLVGVQAAVPLLVCLGLLCYWKALESTQRWLYLTVLALLFLLAPWYREFLAIVPLLIGFLEWQRTRRLSPLMILAAAGLAHAVYPTALIKLLFLPELPLQPVFALGNLQHTLDAGGFRWFAAAHFVPLFPPLLLVLAMSSAVAGAATLRRRYGGEVRSLLPAVVLPVWLMSVLLLLIVPLDGWLLPVALCLGVAVIGLFQDPVLPLWFLAAFLPILRVFTEHIHFLYAVVPASIILAVAVERLWLASAAWGRWTTWMRPLLAGCLALVAADQAANLYGAFRVHHATYDGMERVARWLQEHIPAGSAVVCNVIHGEEIKWRSAMHFENYWTVSAGVFDYQRVLDRPHQLNALLGRVAKQRPIENRSPQVYYLDVDVDYLPGREYHRHVFVHALRAPREDLGIVHRTHVRYFFVDPLRHLVPREFVPFLGAPDLVNDFYVGRSSRHRPFLYTTGATYHLYRALSCDYPPAPAAFSTPTD